MRCSGTREDACCCWKKRIKLFIAAGNQPMKMRAVAEKVDAVACHRWRKWMKQDLCC